MEATSEARGQKRLNVWFTRAKEHKEEIALISDSFFLVPLLDVCLCFPRIKT